MRASQFCRQESPPSWSESSKSDHLVQCACKHCVVQNNHVTSILMKYQICVFSSSKLNVMNTSIIWALALPVQYHSWFMSNSKTMSKRKMQEEKQEEQRVVSKSKPGTLDLLRTGSDKKIFRFAGILTVSSITCVPPKVSWICANSVQME